MGLETMLPVSLHSCGASVEKGFPYVRSVVSLHASDKAA